ncbi:MAG: hypothetical protein ACI93T_004424, partial [Porticoccaceae bacterium]
AELLSVDALTIIVVPLDDALLMSRVIFGCHAIFLIRVL